MSPLGSVVPNVLRRHAWFLAIAGGYVIVAMAVLGEVRPGLGEVVGFPLLAFAVALLAEVTRLRWHHARRQTRGVQAYPEGLWKPVGTDLRKGMLAPPRLAGGLLVLLVTAVFLDAFITWKTAIPRFRPYAWDPRFAELDAALHGGVQPWVWTHRLLPGRLLGMAVDYLYGAWYVVVVATLTWQAFARPGGARRRFLVSFLLTWILVGTVAATLLASGGPVYYERLTGSPGPFGELFAALDAWGLRARELQELLWLGFAGENDFLAEGISAMPSVHVAMATLLACFGWKVGRAAGWAYTAFAVVILVGSVHLGWHYAVDGYVGAAMAAAIWWAVRPLASRPGPPRSAPPAPAPAGPPARRASR